MMIFDHASQIARSDHERLLTERSEQERLKDQADGLRQMRRVDASNPSLPSAVDGLDERLAQPVEPTGVDDRQVTRWQTGHTRTSINVLPWPRVVIVSEFPSTDVGARFAWHLVQSLSVQTSTVQNLLIDLTPAASRLPHVLADVIPSNSYAPLWSQLASGRPLVAQPARRSTSVAVAAESQSNPCAFDQLPRVYEQLVRQLSRQADRLRWIVLLAMDSVVPLDRACWQAADDIILLHGAESTGCQRQAAALRNRIEEDDPRRTVWTLPKRRTGWRSKVQRSLLGGFQDVALSTRWLEAGIVTRLLPSVAWPERSHGIASEQRLREGSRTDRGLMRSAQGVADALRLSAACQNSSDVVSRNDIQKKIQLGQHVRPIRESSDEFRA